MSNAVKVLFKLLILSLEKEGWAEDIIDDVKILKRKYLKQMREEARD